MATGGTYQKSRNERVTNVGRFHRTSIRTRTNRTFFSPRLIGPSRASSPRKRAPPEMARTSGGSMSVRTR